MQNYKQTISLLFKGNKNTIERTLKQRLNVASDGK